MGKIAPQLVDIKKAQAITNNTDNSVQKVAALDFPYINTL